MDNTFNVDSSWTLFLDRDGVINKKIPNDYVKEVNEFHFLPGVLESIKVFNAIFNRIIVVTNQQGIDKERMTHEDLEVVHNHMLDIIEKTGGHIDQVYYCPHLAVYDPLCRKPNPGMALQAQKDFPEIDFKKSIMVGDSESDVVFGNNLGMKTVYIASKSLDIADLTISTLSDLINHIKVTT